MTDDDATAISDLSLDLADLQEEEQDEQEDAGGDDGPRRACQQDGGDHEEEEGQKEQIQSDERELLDGEEPKDGTMQHEQQQQQLQKQPPHLVEEPLLSRRASELSETTPEGESYADLVLSTGNLHASTVTIPHANISHAVVSADEQNRARGQDETLHQDSQQKENEGEKNDPQQPQPQPQQQQPEGGSSQEWGGSCDFYVPLKDDGEEDDDGADAGGGKGKDRNSHVQSEKGGRVPTPPPQQGQLQQAWLQLVQQRQVARHQHRRLAEVAAERAEKSRRAEESSRRSSSVRGGARVRHGTEYDHDGRGRTDRYYDAYDSRQRELQEEMRDEPRMMTSSRVSRSGGYENEPTRSASTRMPGRGPRNNRDGLRMEEALVRTTYDEPRRTEYNPSRQSDVNRHRQNQRREVQRQNQRRGREARRSDPYSTRRRRRSTSRDSIGSISLGSLGSGIGSVLGSLGDYLPGLVGGGARNMLVDDVRMEEREAEREALTVGDGGGSVDDVDYETYMEEEGTITEEEEEEDVPQTIGWDRSSRQLRGLRPSGRLERTTASSSSRRALISHRQESDLSTRGDGSSSHRPPRQPSGLGGRTAERRADVLTRAVEVPPGQRVSRRRAVGPDGDGGGGAAPPGASSSAAAAPVGSTSGVLPAHDYVVLLNDDDQGEGGGGGSRRPVRRSSFRRSGRRRSSGTSDEDMLEQQQGEGRGGEGRRRSSEFDGSLQSLQSNDSSAHYGMHESDASIDTADLIKMAAEAAASAHRDSIHETSHTSQGHHHQGSQSSVPEASNAAPPEADYVIALKDDDDHQGSNANHDVGGGGGNNRRPPPPSRRESRRSERSRAVSAWGGRPSDRRGGGAGAYDRLEQPQQRTGAASERRSRFDRPGGRRKRSSSFHSSSGSIGSIGSIIGNMLYGNASQDGNMIREGEVDDGERVGMLTDDEFDYDDAQRQDQRDYHRDRAPPSYGDGRRRVVRAQDHQESFYSDRPARRSHRPSFAEEANDSLTLEGDNSTLDGHNVEVYVDALDVTSHSVLTGDGYGDKRLEVALGGSEESLNTASLCRHTLHDSASLEGAADGHYYGKKSGKFGRGGSNREGPKRKRGLSLDLIDRMGGRLRCNLDARSVDTIPLSEAEADDLDQHGGGYDDQHDRRGGIPGKIQVGYTYCRSNKRPMLLLAVAAAVLVAVTYHKMSSTSDAPIVPGTPPVTPSFPTQIEDEDDENMVPMVSAALEAALKLGYSQQEKDVIGDGAAHDEKTKVVHHKKKKDFFGNGESDDDEDLDEDEEEEEESVSADDNDKTPAPLKVLVECTDEDGCLEVMDAGASTHVNSIKNSHLLSIAVDSVDFDKLRTARHVKRVDLDYAITAIEDELELPGDKVDGEEETDLLHARQSDEIDKFDGIRRRQKESLPVGLKILQAVDESGAPFLPGPHPRKICVADTGTCLGHPDLPTSASSVYGADMILDAYSSNPIVQKWNLDRNGHGCHLAGLIQAINDNKGVRGIGGHALGSLSLFVTRALSEIMQGTTSQLIKAVEQCVSAGADIITLSLGCPGCYSESTNDFFHDIVHNKGIMVFAASGNNGHMVDVNDFTKSMYYPASYESVISIGAVNQYSGRWHKSNFNDQLEFCAHGYAVNSTGFDSYSFDSSGNAVYNPNYHERSGTSMAAPQAAAAAALLWSHFPKCTGQQIRATLAATAVENAGASPERGAPGCNQECGFGIIKLQDAYDLIRNSGEGENYDCNVAGSVLSSTNKVCDCIEGTGGCQDLSTARSGLQPTGPQMTSPGMMCRDDDDSPPIEIVKKSGGRKKKKTKVKKVTCKMLRAKKSRTKSSWCRKFSGLRSMCKTTCSSVGFMIAGCYNPSGASAYGTSAYAAEAGAAQPTNAAPAEGASSINAAAEGGASSISAADDGVISALEDDP